MTPRSLMALCREKGVRCVEVRYLCLNGQIERFHIPSERLTEELFEVGFPFQGIGFSSTHSSANAALVPLADTAYLAPFRSQTTLVLLAEIQDAVTHRDDDFDPRGILLRAVEAWRSTGICDKLLLGQTVEVVLLKSLKCRQSENGSELHIETFNEGGDICVLNDPQKSDANKNNYMDATPKAWPEGTPVSDISTYCGEVLQHLSQVGIDVEYASDSTTHPGHCRFRLGPVEPLRAADIHLLACEIIRVTAVKYGLIACFLPTINAKESLLGWDLRMSLVKSGDSLVTGTKHFGLSDKGLAVTAGLLRNLGACMAFTNPSDISYFRLHELLANHHEKRAETEIHPFVHVLASTNQLVDRSIELSICDLTSNPHLAIASLLMAALNGVEDNLTIDEKGRLSVAGEREPKTPPRLPTTLEKAIARLRANHDFLLAHDVFSLDVLKVWRKQLLDRRSKSIRELSPASEFLSHYR